MRKSSPWQVAAPVGLVAVLAVTVAVMGFLSVRRMERDQARAVFGGIAKDRLAALRERIGANLLGLDLVGRFYDGGEKVERLKFRLFVAPFLARRRCVQAVEWIPCVPDAERDAYTLSVRQEGFPEFEITEEQGHGRMIQAPRREEYFPVHFLEPYGGNEKALGLDLASEAVRLEGLNRARDSGEMVATGPITLVQEPEEQLGFLVFVPVYRRGARLDTARDRHANLSGFAVGVFRGDDLLRETTSQFHPAGIDMALFDQSSPGGERLIAWHPSRLRNGPASEAAAASGTRRDGLHYSARLTVAGRDWLLVCTPAPEFLAAQGQWGSWLFLVAELALIAVLVTSLAANGRRASRLERLTAQLSGANERLGLEVADRKRAEKALSERTEALARSNAELEQFAYVASHDLQEPLRMVTAYVQMLARRYQGKLDANADEFIAFAVDGAQRMSVLINDLLSYSRVTTRGKDFAPTDCKAVMENVLADLQVAIEESGAVVTHDPLPTILADGVQIGRVFQNLVGNAIKYHGAQAPRVHVSAGRQGEEWRFAVRDNGIGIAPEHQERIFVIFQRLHARQEYVGTGIGLAICKKTVERHGGRIWVESEPGKGSTFYFTVPIREAEANDHSSDDRATQELANQRETCGNPVG